MVYLFWLGVASSFHSYILFPLTLPILGWFFRAKKVPPDSRQLPDLSLLLAVHNEEDILEDKIKNCFELEYPREKLEIIIGSDASSDNTNSILEKYNGQNGLKIFTYSERGGKSSVLNKITRESRGKILVFCDANTMLLKNALIKLVSHFTDSRVGGVCGRLILNDSKGLALSHGESLYWRMESGIKNLEGKMGIVVGANGGLYGIRKSLYQEIPENKTVMDDFFITTNILKKGFGVYYEPLAIGTEETSLDTFGEFRRKIRIGEANFNLFLHYLPLLNPKRILVAYSFFSHKFIRWLGPLILLEVLTLNFLLVLQDNHQWIYIMGFLLQICFYSAAYTGYLHNKNRKNPSILFEAPFYFVSMNIALFLGLVKSIFGKKKGSWDRIKRGQPD